MNKPSTSPQRYTFLKNQYLARCEKLGEIPNSDHIKIYEDFSHIDKQWAESQDHNNDLEWDLRVTEWILNKVRNNDIYSQHLYAALCNNSFEKISANSPPWHCSWRHAGGIIADMRQQGDSINWYCSGMGGVVDYDTDPADWRTRTGYVPEGEVSEEIANDLHQLGWRVITAEENKP